MAEDFVVTALRNCRQPSRIASAFLVALALSLSTTHTARADSSDSMQGLDQQVQEIKSDVLAIASELRELEEKLLYPSDTQVAVFVSLAPNDDLDLDSLQIQIDGEAVARHVYSLKEVEALRKGGVQRIYTGNVRTGKHKLDVSMAGKLSSGTDFEKSASFPFEKAVEPKVVGLTVAGGAPDGARIELGGW